MVPRDLKHLRSVFDFLPGAKRLFSEGGGEKMNRRSFITALTMVVLLPKALWAKSGTKNKLLVKNGWVLKEGDI